MSYNKLWFGVFSRLLFFTLSESQYFLGPFSTDGNRKRTFETLRRRFISESNITPDKSWFHHGESNSGYVRHSTEFITHSSPGKLMVPTFQRMEGPVLVHFTNKGETVNIDNYCEQLRLLKPKLKTKIVINSQKAFFLQDNIRPTRPT